MIWLYLMDPSTMFWKSSKSFLSCNPFSWLAKDARYIDDCQVSFTGTTHRKRRLYHRTKATNWSLTPYISFTGRGTGKIFTRSILLEYSDRRRAALGQCRIGATQDLQVIAPTAMYVNRVLYNGNLSGALVQFTSSRNLIDPAGNV